MVKFDILWVLEVKLGFKDLRGFNWVLRGLKVLFGF